MAHTYTTDNPYIELQIQSAIALAIGAVNHFQQTFLSGDIAFAGPNGTLIGSSNFTAGLAIPNPGGVAGPALLLGSGGGGGTAVQFWILQDEASDSITPGNTLGITAGETQPSGVAAGGLLWLLGGASFGGQGGTALVQGGTSAHSLGGFAIVQGGNNTDLTQPPGDAFVSGGQEGNQGANVQLLMTMINGISGVVRIRVNSTPLWDFFHDGSIFNYVNPTGPSFGLPGQPMLSGGPGQPCSWGSANSTPLFTGTVFTGPLTSGGTPGTLTFSSGILISQTNPT